MISNFVIDNVVDNVRQNFLSYILCKAGLSVKIVSVIVLFL